MNKINNYWHRWCLCYKENGLKYTIKKTFMRFAERFKKSKNKEIEAKNDVTAISKAEYNPDSVEDSLALRKDRVNVGFFIGGGMGDIVVASNYLYKFREKYDDEIMRLDVFLNKNFKVSQSILYKDYVIDNLYNSPAEKIKMKNYDVFFILSRYPNIKRRNDTKLRFLMPELFEYIHLCERFRAENPRFFLKTCYDGQSAILSIIDGKTRINQLDIYGFLGVTEKYEYKIPIMEDEIEYLDILGLKSKKFITLNRSVDADGDVKTSVKMWPLAYYCLLADMLKEKYPDITVVQLGPSADRSEKIYGVDINLVGATNVEQLKVLLKHSLVHIDGEGGMVHLRHAISGGKSVVLFGSTSADFFGYSENENIVGDGCDTWCEWAVLDWQRECPRGNIVPPCMLSITPEMVMASVEKIISKEISE